MFCPLLLFSPVSRCLCVLEVEIERDGYCPSRWLLTASSGINYSVVFCRTKKDTIPILTTGPYNQHIDWRPLSSLVPKSSKLETCAILSNCDLEFTKMSFFGPKIYQVGSICDPLQLWPRIYGHELLQVASRGLWRDWRLQFGKMGLQEPSEKIRGSDWLIQQLSLFYFAYALIFLRWRRKI